MSAADPLQRTLRMLEQAAERAAGGVAGGLAGERQPRARGLLLQMLFLSELARRGGISGPGPEGHGRLEAGSLRDWLAMTRRWLPDDTPHVGALLELEPGSLLASWGASNAVAVPRLGPIFAQLPDRGAGVRDELVRMHSSRERRARGRFYTHPRLAEFIVRQTLPLPPGMTAEEILGLRVLDPAVGGGVFLLEAAYWLGAGLAARSGLSMGEAIRRVIGQCLYGVDIDPEALQVTRWELLLAAAGDSRPPRENRRVVAGDSRPSRENRRVVAGDSRSTRGERRVVAGDSVPSPEERLPGSADGLLPVLGKRLCRADALLGAERVDLPWRHSPQAAITPFAADAFTVACLHPELSLPAPGLDPGRFLAEIEAAGLSEQVAALARAEGYIHWDLSVRPVLEGGFHAVIGNPPYLSELRGGSSLFARLKTSPRAGRFYAPKGDLFYQFMALGIELLRPGGMLGMIVPPYWRTRTAASRLRGQIQDCCRVRARAEFGECRVFDDAQGHHSEILVLERAGGRCAGEGEGMWMRILEPRLSADEAAALLLRGTAEPGRLECLPLSAPRLELQVGPPSIDLSLRPTFTLSSGEVSQGVVMPQSTLSRDGLSRLPADSARVGDGIFWLRDSELEALNLDALERSFVVPYLPVASVWPCFLGNPEGWLLYLDAAAARMLGETPERYPRLVAHLRRFAPAITSSRGPFGLHRPRQREWFESPDRIVVVRKTLFMKAARACQPRFVDQGMNVIRPLEPGMSRYLLGVLHSSVVDHWLRRRKSMGLLLQVDKDVLCELPIPRAAPPSEALRGEMALELAAGNLDGVVYRGVCEAGRHPEVARAAIEALVEAWEVGARAVLQPGGGEYGMRKSRPGRGGRFRPEQGEPDREVEALRRGVNALVAALYGLAESGSFAVQPSDDMTDTSQESFS